MPLSQVVPEIHDRVSVRSAHVLRVQEVLRAEESVRVLKRVRHDHVQDVRHERRKKRIYYH